MALSAACRAGARPNYNSAIATWTELALSGVNLEVHGDRHMRNFVDIHDVQAVVAKVALTPQVPLAVDVHARSSTSITVPAGIIAKLSGVQMIVPEADHGSSQPAGQAPWTIPGQDAVACGLIAGWTPLEEGLTRAFHNEKAARETRVKNNVVAMPVVDGVRGRMVEMFGPETQRVYEIVVEPGYVRGNHCHKEQHEEFYVSEGRVVFELQPGLPEYLPQALAVQALSSGQREKIQIKPTYMHTLWNPSPLHPALVLVSSTQRYIPNCSPDTFWPQNAKQ